MPLIDSANIRPNAGNWVAAQEMVASRTQHVQQARENFAIAVQHRDTMRAAVDYARPYMSDLLHPGDNAPSGEVLNQLHMFLMRPWDQMRYNLTDAINQARDTEHAIEICERELANARARAAAIPEPPSFAITPDVAAAALKHHKVRWARLYRNARDEDELRFTLFDVQMAVKDLGGYSRWFRAIGNAPTIKLPPVTCVINFNRNTIHFVPLKSELRRYPRGMPSLTIAHPHIPGSGGNPCLGDFGMLWAEAVNSGDISFMASVISLFLGNCDARDPAGRHYWRFLLGETAIEEGDVGGSYCKFNDRYYYMGIGPGGKYKLWSAEVVSQMPTFTEDDLITPPSDYDAHARDLDAEEDLFIDHYLASDWVWIATQTAAMPPRPLVTEVIPTRIIAQPASEPVTRPDGTTMPEGVDIEEVW